MSNEFPELDNIEILSLSDLEFLERGEIESIENLKGHAPIMVVKIKGDGEALFKPEGVEYDDFFTEKGAFRGELEFLVFLIDKILGTDMVPLTAKRKIADLNGVVQKFVSDAVLATKLNNWAKHASESEILKATVVDYLIGAKDRSGFNFLVNTESGKIWLIDHDYYMMFFDEEHSTEDVIAKKAKILGISKVPEDLIVGLSALPSALEQLISEAEDPRIKTWLAEIKKRALILLETKRIP